MSFYKVSKIIENIEKEAIKACIIAIQSLNPNYKSSNWILIIGHPHDHPLIALEIGD